MKKKILWLIPARSGSKSITHKNIKILGEHPLISYRIKSARLSKFTNDIWVSTDSKKYAFIAKKYGAIIPFLRPDSLATDNASSVDVVLHAMNHANKLNQTYEYIGLLEPTSPFISIEDLDGSIDLIEKNKEATAIVAVKESRPHKIFIQKNSKFLDELAGNLDKVKKLSRQNFTKEITPSGGFYIARWDSFLQSKTFYTNKTLSFEVDEFSGIEIDEILDWEFAEFLILKQSEIEK